MVEKIAGVILVKHRQELCITLLKMYDFFVNAIVLIFDLFWTFNY